MTSFRGVARIFQRGGHTVSKQGLFNYGQDIVMAFSPPVVGCLVKKGLQKWGHGHLRTPPPGYALVTVRRSFVGTHSWGRGEGPSQCHLRFRVFSINSFNIALEVFLTSRFG